MRPSYTVVAFLVLILIFIGILAQIFSVGKMGFGYKNSNESKPNRVIIPTIETPSIEPTTTSPIFEWRARMFDEQFGEQIVGLHLSVELISVSVETLTIVNRQEAPETGEVFVVDSESCGLSVLSAVELARTIALERGIPWNIWGPLILSESSYRQFVSDAYGNCTVIENSIGAYCLAQVYMAVHPQYTKQALADPRACLNAGADILLQKYSRTQDWHEAVARYKGITRADFTQHRDYKIFNNYHAAGGFIEPSGYWISW